MKKVVVTKAQVLHLLTVFIIVPVSGYVTAWVSKHFPGLPNFSSTEVEAVFLTGAGSALAAGIHYLHGWQVWERTIGRVVDVEAAKPPTTTTTSGGGNVPTGGQITGV